MKKILTFSVCMILALFLSQGNITANAKCAMNDIEEAMSEEGVAEEAASVVEEENREDGSDKVVDNDKVVADKAVVVPATKVSVAEAGQTDDEEQSEDCIKVDADESSLQATVKEEQEVISGEAEEPAQDTENLPEDSEIIAGAPPVVVEEEAPAEEVVAKEVTSEKVVTVEPQEIANSGAKTNKVQNSSKKVNGSVKTVQSEKNTAADAENASNLELPQTGVLDENIFYVLGFFVCALGIGTLACMRKGM